MTFESRQKAMFVANFVSKLNSEDSWEYLIGLDAALTLNKSVPLKPADWQWAFAGMQVARTKGRQESGGSIPKPVKYLETLFNTLDGDNKLLAPLIEYTKDLIKDDSSIERLNLNDAAKESAARGRTFSQFAARAAELAGQLYDAATTPGNDVDAYWERHMARDLGSISATPEQVVERNPQLKGILQDLDRSPDDADRLAVIEVKVDGLSAEVTKNMSALNRNSERQTVTLDKLIEQADETRKMQQEQVRATTRESALAGTIALYAFFGGNQKSIRQLSGVLNAAITLRKAVDAYNFSIDAGSSKAASGLALSGEWVGAAMALVAAFGDAGPTFEGQAMEALAQISQQLHDIQQQMFSSFEAVDKRLSEISGQINDGFNLIAGGLRQNQFRLDTLLDTSFNISKALANNNRAITDRLDFIAQAETREIQRLRSVRDLNQGAGLTTAELRDAVSKIDECINSGRDPVISGPDLTDINAALKWVRTVSLDEDVDWERNINTYRALARNLGLPVSRGRLCKPSRWRFAVEAYIDMRVNGSDVPLSSDDELTKRLITEGQQHLTEIADITAFSPERSDSVDVLIKFLLDEYGSALDDVAKAATAVHRKNLDAVGSELGTLTSFSVFKSEAGKVTGYEYPPGTIEPRPMTEAYDGLPTALPPGSLPNSIDDFWTAWTNNLNPLLKFCVPSFKAPPGLWPILSQAVGVRLLSTWNRDDFTCAVMADALGLGKLGIEYRVEVASMRWANWPSVLLGVPMARYFLILTTAPNNGKRIVAASVANLSGEGSTASLLAEAADSNVISPLQVIFDARNAVSVSNVIPAPLSPMAPATSWDAQLLMDIYRRYGELATSIRAELITQLDAPASPLGAASQRLSRVVNIIRGVCIWLLPFTFDDADLRSSLFGSARVCFWDLLQSVKVGDLPIPLLDSGSLRDLLESGGDSPDQWEDIVTLNSINRAGVYSAETFRKALKRSRARNSEKQFATEISDSVYRLREVQKLFAVA